MEILTNVELWSAFLIIALLLIFTAMLAIETIEMLQVAEKSIQIKYLIISSFVIGFTLWTSYFLGMIMYRKPGYIPFQPFAVLLSSLPVMVATGATLYLLMKMRPSKKSIGISAIIIIAGLALMHFIMSTTMAAWAKVPVGTVRITNDPIILAALVTIAAFVLLAFAFISIHMKYKLIVQEIDAKNRFQALMESAHDAIIVTDHEHTIVQWNSGAERLFGYDKAFIIGKPIFTVVPPHIHAQYQGAVATFLSLEDHSNFNRMIETLGLDHKQNEFPIEVSIGTWKNNDRPFVSYIIRDITDRKQEKAQMIDLIYLDDLTGLPNRRMFNDELETVLKRAKEREVNFSLICLDVDNLKLVNDTYGHPIGDRLLVEITKRIYKNLAMYDTLARISGDEFCYLLTDTTRESTEAFAQKLINAFKEPFDVHGHMIMVTTSIGISMFPVDGTDADTLLNCTHDALLHIKTKGKNGYSFYEKVID